jgi:hypothetical protein
VVTRAPRLYGAGTFRDFADDPAAGSTSDLCLDLSDAEVSGCRQCLDLVDDALLYCWTPEMLSARFGSSHSRGYALANERRLQLGHGADDGEHRAAHRAVGVDLILDADKAHAEMVKFFQRRSRCRVLRAKRSNFQTNTQSMSRFLAADIRALR